MAELHVPHAGGHSDYDNPAVHHETSDVNIRGILVFAVGLIVAAVIIHALIWLMFRALDASASRKVTPQYPLAITQENRLPPEPRLQTNPRQDLNDLRTAEEQVLESYGWVDKNKGVVRIPIDEAIKLTIQRGLPAREGGAR